MKKTCLIIAAVTALASPALAQQQKPGNCALYGELSAETIQRDARTAGPQRAVVVEAFNTYAEAQSRLADAEMENAYAQYASLGYSKDQVDNLIMTTMNSMRAGFHTSTMDKNKIYMDHVMLLNTCVQGAKSADELGQSPQAMISALEQMMAWAQS
jgi:hypothetical protein